MADHPPSVHPRRAARRVDSTGAVTRCLVLQTDHPRLVRAARGETEEFQPVSGVQVGLGVPSGGLRVLRGSAGCRAYGISAAGELPVPGSLAANFRIQSGSDLCDPQPSPYLQKTETSLFPASRPAPVDLRWANEALPFEICEPPGNSTKKPLRGRSSRKGVNDPVSAHRGGLCFSGGSGTTPGPEDRGSRPSSSVLLNNERDTL